MEFSGFPFDTWDVFSGLTSRLPAPLNTSKCSTAIPKSGLGDMTEVGGGRYYSSEGMLCLGCLPRRQKDTSYSFPKQSIIPRSHCFQGKGKTLLLEEKLGLVV